MVGAQGRTMSARPGRRRRGWTSAVRRLGVTCALTLGAAALPATAQAAPGVGTHGPATEAFGFFPEWYEDKGGLRLELCTSGPLCMATLEVPLPKPDEPARYPDNFPSEAFWWAAETTLTYPGGSALLVLAQEAAFATEVVADGDQIAFGRLRIRATGLVPGAWYRFTHPYGEVDLQAVDKAPRVVNHTRDIGCLALCTGTAFSLPGASDIGPNFLQWDASAPYAPEGYIGDPSIPHAVTGSEFVPAGETEAANYFRVQRITGRGGTVVETIGRTDTFAVQGKLAGPPAGYLVASAGGFGSQRVGSTATRTMTLRNGGSGDLALEGLQLTGAQAEDFTVGTGTCVLPATLLPGQSCTVAVTFAPTAPGARSAQLLVSEGRGLRTIALSGTGTAPPPPPPPAPGPPAPGSGSGGGATGPVAPLALPPAAALPAAPVVFAAPSPVAGGTVSDVRVAGVTTRSSAVARVSLSRKVTRAKARRQGVRVSMRLPTGTRLVRLRVYRVSAGGRRTRVGLAVRVASTRTYAVRLKDRGLRRSFTPGAYQVEITPGRSAFDLGTTTSYGFRVVR
jgi:hypothetical protein